MLFIILSESLTCHGKRGKIANYIKDTIDKDGRMVFICIISNYCHLSALPRKIDISTSFNSNNTFFSFLYESKMNE